MKLTDLTPKDLMCGCPNCKCPAVFETDHGTFVIIGKKLAPEDYEQIKDKVAEDEYVIEIPKEYFANVALHEEVVL